MNKFLMLAALAAFVLVPQADAGKRKCKKKCDDCEAVPTCGTACGATYVAPVSTVSYAAPAVSSCGCSSAAPAISYSAPIETAAPISYESAPVSSCGASTMSYESAPIQTVSYETAAPAMTYESAPMATSSCGCGG